MAGPLQSAGLLMYRRGNPELEVFLVHPGGPFFQGKDLGVWTIPKGLYEPGEDPLDAAAREFEEETGQRPETCASGRPDFVSLGTVKQRGGKTVHAWAFEGSWPSGAAPCSNTFSMEWPHRSGTSREFPEIDAWEFFPASTAREKINPAQIPLIERLIASLAAKP